MIDRIVEKALDGEDTLSAHEIAALYEAPLFSLESAKIIAAGREKSSRACDGKAEVHALVGLTPGTVSEKLPLCSFAACDDAA